MHPQVVGGVARIEPLVVALIVVRKTLDDSCSYTLYELRDQAVDDSRLSRSRGVCLRSFEFAWQPSELPRAGGVR